MSVARQYRAKLAERVAGATTGRAMRAGRQAPFRGGP